MKMNLNEYMAICRKELDAAISGFLSRYSNQVPALHEAMAYAATGGKRLRGVSLLAAFEGWLEDRAKAMNFAVAIEMIHAYSLVHDDMPCMDNDDWRRGKSSCHKKYGEAVALLVGDALLTGAFEAMLQTPGINPELVNIACMEVAVAAGARGMVGGQYMDLGLPCKNDVCYISKMYHMKTAALFKASASAGGILAGAPAGYIRALSGWGKYFGYAFQIIDDLQDLIQDENNPEKTTLANQVPVEKAREEANKALGHSIEEIKMYKGNTWFFSGLSQRYARVLEESRFTFPVDRNKGRS